MEYILYGLDNYKEIIYQIKNDINNSYIDFDIELLLSEALTNAFIHGNKSDATKPIYLRYKNYGNKVIFEIEDCGSGLENIAIPTEISEDNLLEESGRGLFLINCFADKVEFFKNTLIIEKQF